MEQLSRYLLNERMGPVMQEFLASYGISDDIIMYLIGMGLSHQEIKEFLFRRFFLRQIDIERANRMNFFEDFYQRQPGDPANRPLSSSIFPYSSSFPYQENKFTLFADYILYKSKYNWEDRVLHESLREFLKSNISENAEKQVRIKNLLNELEIMEENDLIEQEIRRREENIRNHHGQAPEEKRKSVWASEDDVERFGLNKIPMRIRPYYIE